VAGALSYPFDDVLPARGETLDVAPGVRWLRMGLPFALDHINLWLLADRDDGGRDGWAIVDCGIDDDATRGDWERVFATGMDERPVLRVIATHLHPDHLGLAHWLTARWGTAQRDCRLWMSATDWNAARVFSRSDAGVGGEAAARFYRLHGLTDEDALGKVRARGNLYARMVPDVPERFRRLMDGMTIDAAGGAWTCIAGYGHAPEHISLHSPALGVLVAGDMLLPRISTNVSVMWMEPEANPLPLFLASIARLRELPADTLVLPSHGRPFRGLRERVAQLERHHDERLAEVLAACRSAPQSAAGLLDLLFRRKLDLHQLTFAMGEAIAHLHALEGAGDLVAEASTDGVIRFAARP
jgi:glyoxylase-like metal-dependent hydrolase (beta-lactamase superfamily II)